MGGSVEVVVGGSVVVVVASLVAGWVALLLAGTLDEPTFDVALDELLGWLPAERADEELAGEEFAAQADARPALTATSAQARANENGDFGKGTRQR
jgi:hypothetical protein